MSQALRCLLLIVTVGCCSFGCYRFPTSEDYSIIPMTNNPDLRDDHSGGSLAPNLPNVNY